MTPTAWLFPGQGAQRKGMGSELFARHPGLLALADEALGFSVRELCLHDPDGRLTQTRYLQPALFVVNALTHLERAAREPAPDFLAGHSLGEYNALLAADAFDFATGVRLVGRRGELMGRATGGGMTAVVGPGVEKVPQALAEAGLDEIDVANLNSPEQIVLSGPLDALRRAAELLREAGLGRCVPLRVSAAFHSRHMADAAKEFAEFLDGFRLRDPQLPVISNVTARPYEPGTVHQLLAEQVRSPVRWSDSMRLLAARGVREIVEVGPGTVLTGLWKARPKDTSEKGEVAGVAAAGTAASVPGQQAAGPGTAAGTAPVPALHRSLAGRVSRTAGRPSAGGPSAGRTTISAADLGCKQFRADYGIRYAYLAGAMYKGVASTELVIRMARAGLMGFFGSGGLALERIEDAVRTLRSELGPKGRFGMNLLHSMGDPAVEDATVGLYLRHDVRFVEAAGFSQVTPALVRYRLSGARRAPDGRPVARRRLLAKVSRPEVAAAFLRPAPPALVRRLVDEGAVSEEEAAAGRSLPMSEELCVEADSGGHTDGGVAYALMPAMLRLRDELVRELDHPVAVRVGASGGLGSPESIAAAFVLGADFVVTGSVNQCTAEAGTSDAVKEMLAGAGVQDTAYAPAGDMFEAGARVQVLRRGTLFAARANKLHQAYRTCGGLDDLGPALRRTIEETYFRRSLDEVWEETRGHYLRTGRPEEIERAERDPKHRMALVFRWYFAHTTRLALRGTDSERVNFQIHTGPAMGAFNRFAEGTSFAHWRHRHVDDIAEALMSGAADTLSDRLRSLIAD